MTEQGAKLDALMSRLEMMLKQPDDQWLTKDELDGVRLLVSYHPELEEIVKAHVARRILIRSLRKTLVALGAAALFITTFYDNIIKIFTIVTGSK